MRYLVILLSIGILALIALAKPSAGQTIPPSIYLPFIARAMPPTATPTPTQTPLPTATNRPTATATTAPTNTPTATATTALLYTCDHDAYNCSDFDTQAEAQEVYNYCVAQGFGDIHRLDGNNNNGLACESLP